MRKPTRTALSVRTTTKQLRTNKPAIDRDSSNSNSGSSKSYKPHRATKLINHKGDSSYGDVATGKQTTKSKTTSSKTDKKPSRDRFTDNKASGHDASVKQTTSSNGKHAHGGTPFEKSVNNDHHEVTDISSLFSPYTVNVVCDGINLTAHLERDEQDILQKRLTSYNGSLRFKKASGMKPYRKGRNIYHEEELIAKLRYDPIDECVGYLLLHVNPSKLNILEDYQIHLLQELFVYLMNDEPWYSFIDRASVSLVDIAVDIKKVSIGSVIPIPSRAVNSGSFLTFYTKGGTRLYKQGTQYVGQNHSEKHACIYDKAEELSGNINVVGDAALTRVEVQFKPRVRGRFAHCPPTVSGLRDFPNPMLMLEFSEYNKEADGDDFLKLATALSTFMGATAVLQLISDRAHKARVKTHLSTPTCAWWKPKQYWLQFLEDLSTHPLFASGLALAD